MCCRGSSTNPVVRPVTPDDWHLVERLFGECGACGGCWCMLWRVPSLGKYWTAHKGSANRRAFGELVRGGQASGLLAIGNGVPIGWCSAGPRADYQYLARARLMPAGDGDARWSVTCFFVEKSHRHRGVAGKLLRGAIRLARTRHATALEGYPLRSTTPHTPDVFAHTGVVHLFESAGFKQVACAGSRAVYRLEFRRNAGMPRRPVAARVALGVIPKARRNAALK